MVDRQPRPFYTGTRPLVSTHTFLQTEISVQKIASLLLTMALILPANLNEHKNLEKFHTFEKKNI
jgi:hypothetical protein